MNHNSVAKSVRLNKERHPDLFCGHAGCLYRTGDCPEHTSLRERYALALIYRALLSAHVVEYHASTATIEDMKTYLNWRGYDETN